MLLGKRGEDALESIALSLKKLTGLLEAQASSTGTSLRTNYTDGRPDGSYYAEVDDTTEFLRDFEAAARIAQGLPPIGEPDGDPEA